MATKTFNSTVEVTKVVKSYKYSNAYIVTYNKIAIDFLTNAEVVTKENQVTISVVEVKPGKQVLTFTVDKEANRFYISAKNAKGAKDVLPISI